MILADYHCPVHGTFETAVESPAPDEVMCPTLACRPECTPDDLLPCCRDCGTTCDLPSRWVPAPIRGSVRLGEVVRGPNERPPNRLSLDTRKMGEGQSLEEYRAERAAIVHEHRKSEIKDFTS
jgi:hypothetical protein